MLIPRTRDYAHGLYSHGRYARKLQSTEKMGNLPFAGALAHFHVRCIFPGVYSLLLYFLTLTFHLQVEHVPSQKVRRHLGG